MSKYTKGPWIFYKHDRGNYAGDIASNWKDEKGSNMTRTIAVILSYAVEEEADANARLIATAPELLEACKKYIAAEDGIVSGIADRKASALSCIRQAITKAEGI